MNMRELRDLSVQVEILRCEMLERAIRNPKTAHPRIQVAIKTADLFLERVFADYAKSRTWRI